MTTIFTATANTPGNGNGPGTLGGEAGGHPTGTQAPVATYPNGYNAYYCGKYEISQQQYVDFLNTLTRPQQNARTATDLSDGITSVTNVYVMSNGIGVFNRNGIRCDAIIDATATLNSPVTGMGTEREVRPPMGNVWPATTSAGPIYWHTWTGAGCAPCPNSNSKRPVAARCLLLPTSTPGAWRPSTPVQ
ncbi:MAG: hypothetical protein H6590_05555 [Flavobacteriales bacterium]|nr:hypothetical protein [Flavobacteriales bacterium]